ncbi:MAG: hypothetical protein AB1805_01595 [Nitrospirota bacterium]
MADAGKRNFKAIAADIAEGFITVNPIFLKPFDANALKLLCTTIERRQSELRAEPFPYHDLLLIRKRNLRLQRLFTALSVIKNYARDRKMTIS